MASKLSFLLSLGAVCDATIFSASEATHASASLRMRLLQQREKEHQKSMEAIMSNMTTASALEIVRKQAQHKPEMLSAIQEGLAAHKQGSKSLRASAVQPAEGYAGVDKARKFLNQMIEEVNVKYDLEIQKCCDYDEMQSTIIEEARQDISMFNAEAAEARAEVLQAESIIEMCEIKLPELNDVLETHNAECHEQITELERLLKIVREDIAVMDLILSLINCQTGAAVLVQRCTNQCGESFYQFQHKDIQHAVSKLQSDSAKQILNDNLADIMSSNTANETTTWAPEVVEPVMKKRSKPCKAPVPEDKRVGKCSMDTNPNCPVMEEKFQYIRAGIIDKETELNNQLTEVTAHCEETTANIEAQISDFEHKLKDAQTALAAGTKKQNNAEENSRLKSVELKGLLGDYHAWTERCHTNYENMESETCGLRKIRGELYKMKGDKETKLFQDCVVSDWVAGECSASCAGGVLKLTRTVLTEPVGGACCPILEGTAPCNHHKCPVDCKLEEWGGWSGCTAKCGGGVMEHTRGVDVEPQHGGQPCGETSESMSCNIQACDQDCVLADWDAWSDCSKECDGGHIYRLRHMDKAPVGNGECPFWLAPERFQWKPCNQFACTPPKGELMMRCNSTLDVVLVIDGSGSLGQKGWDASVKAGAMLARAFGGSHTGAVNLAVIKFSRSSEIIQHFTTDAEEAATAIEGMSWPRSLTYTSKALNLAASELSLGREDANSVVIVLTDGRPMSPLNTRQAAEKLRKQARLMFVPVTRWAPLDDIKTWASKPIDENIIAIDDFDALKEPEELTKIIADVCPHVI